MLAFTLRTVDNAGSMMICLLRNGMSRSLEALFACKPELVCWRDRFAHRDRVGIAGILLTTILFAVRKRSLACGLVATGLVCDFVSGLVCELLAECWNVERSG